ncbi:hypothetical protein MAR_009582 [Mya arenaria]|uniref:Uncharacterized protein n=1 Tax=Mya arenaria TaxID=6604 RepID=A0ABY7E1C5_MYAAR|nr:hypothetical protein MAR_009582 [Mya arenaria]
MHQTASGASVRQGSLAYFARLSWTSAAPDPV